MDPFIAHHLLGVSRTYAIVVPMLPAPLADAVGVAYLLMRIVDTVEDATELTSAARNTAFELLERALVGETAAGAALARPTGDESLAPPPVNVRTPVRALPRHGAWWVSRPVAILFGDHE